MEHLSSGDQEEEVKRTNVPTKIQGIYRLWSENGLTFGELGEIYGLGWFEVSKLLRRYYPEVDFKAEGLKRSQEMRGCLSRKEKLNLVRYCKCKCGEVLPQFVEKGDGRIVRNKRLYIKGHR